MSNLSDLYRLTRVTTGFFGSDRINNTSANEVDTGFEWSAIQCVSDCTFTDLTGDMDNADGLALVAGMVIYGRFTSITLASGSVIAYRTPVGE